MLPTGAETPVVSGSVVPLAYVCGDEDSPPVELPYTIAPEVIPVTLAPGTVEDANCGVWTIVCMLMGYSSVMSR
jgi:hypothetical protein